jgi:hypothetical protein
LKENEIENHVFQTNTKHQTKQSNKTFAESVTKIFKDMAAEKRHTYEL